MDQDKRTEGYSFRTRRAAAGGDAQRQPPEATAASAPPGEERPPAVPSAESSPPSAEADAPQRPPPAAPAQAAGPRLRDPAPDPAGGRGRRVPSAVRAAEEDLPTIDIRGVLLKLWRGRWIIAGSMLAAALLAFVPISRMEPTYRATAKVMFNLQQAEIDVGQVVLGSATETTLQNQVEILRSTRLIEGVVDRLALDRNPEFNPFLPSGAQDGAPAAEPAAGFGPPPAPGDAPVAPDAAAGPTPADAAPDDVTLERRLVVANVVARLGLLPIEGTRVIEITFDAGDPQTAAAVANAVAEQYITDQLTAKLDATRAATTWLAETVEDLRGRVQAAEEAVEAGRAEQSLEAGQGIEITRQQLLAANGSLISARNDVMVVRAMVERLTTALDEGRDFGAVPDLRASPIISAYRAELVDLSSQATQFTEGSVRLTEITRRTEEVEELMAEEAGRILEAARADLASKEERERLLVSEIRELESKAFEQSREQVAIRQLEREAEASRVLYESFLNRLKETTAAEDLRTDDARILSPAEPPLGPLAEAKQRTLVLALIAGALVGIGIVFLLEKLNYTFRSPAQVEELTGEAVIGTLPSLGRHFHKTDVLRHFQASPKSSLAESIRSLRTSILFSNVDDPPGVVMFTSSVPGEGKSTTAMLVALTSRQMGKSAIIVDCDLRLPALGALFEPGDDRPGLLSVIEGTATLDEAIFRDGASGLHVLMTKPSEPATNMNAADVLASNRFGEVLAELRGRYDLVILDTPPALVVADARIVSRLVDAVVYMIRWDRTPRDAVEEGLKEMRYVSAPLAGVALTLINEQRAAKYAHDGYAYHKGRYTDYFDAGPRPPGRLDPLWDLLEGRWARRLRAAAARRGAGPSRQGGGR